MDLQSAPSTRIAYTAPPNTPNVLAQNFAPVFPAAEYSIDLHAPYNYMHREHAYHPPIHLHQLPATYYQVPGEEPISCPDRTPSRTGISSAHPYLCQPAVTEHFPAQETMLQAAASGGPSASLPGLDSQYPYYQTTHEHSQAVAGSPGDQATIGQNQPRALLEHAIGPVIQNFPVPAYFEFMSAAPFDGPMGSASMSVHPSSVHIASPTDQADSPASSVPSDIAYACQCLCNGSPCRTLLTGETKELRSHLKHVHQFRATGKKYHRCLWEGCRRVLQRENIPRHITSCHLRVKVRCITCGVGLSRGDVQYSHARRCSARLSKQV
ncbi:hypothetical protein BS17DRAFT_382794 [Gyrodon lividus]|nr:hypothetical protein BS17DRAFT_382794 [Gyrodon lividus]